MVKFLFGGDDAEQVQDECQQKHRYEDEHHRTEIVDITILTFQYGRRVPAGPALVGDALLVALHIFDCTKYSMDAFTGKEQNRANVVPMVCQLKIGKNFKAKKRIRRVLLLSAGKQIVISVFLW